MRDPCSNTRNRQTRKNTQSQLSDEKRPLAAPAPPPARTARSSKHTHGKPHRLHSRTATDKQGGGPSCSDATHANCARWWEPHSSVLQVSRISGKPHAHSCHALNVSGRARASSHWREKTPRSGTATTCHMPHSGRRRRATYMHMHTHTHMQPPAPPPSCSRSLRVSGSDTRVPYTPPPIGCAPTCRGVTQTSPNPSLRAEGRPPAPPA